jgi:hypothetical protein
MRQTENEILIDLAEKRITLIEAIERLEDIGFELPEAKALAEAWLEFIAENGPMQ